jgi:glycine oxidase
MIGQLAPGVVAATGHYRNGILLAPLTADVVSRLILDGDRDPALDLTDPGRNPGAA